MVGVKEEKTMEKTANFAIVGYGGMGSWHAKLLKSMPQVQVSGIYDIDPSRCKAAARAGIRPYGSYEELLNDPTVELVIVAAPNDLHKELSIKAMDAGKNVICEKPVALGSGELREMIAASARNQVLFTVHQNRRWDEDFLIAKQLYDRQTLGKVFRIESRVHGSRGIPGDWRNTKQHGGGMVLDWGVHLLDQIMMLIPEKPKSVYAVLSHVTNEEVDDGFQIQLLYESGLSCLVEVGTSNFINLPRWYIQGENGTAVIEDWDLSGKLVMVSDWEKRDAVPVVTAAGLTKTMAPRTDETIREYPLPKIQADVKDFYRNAIQAARKQEQAAVTHPQLLDVMKLMEAVFRSAEENKVITEVW